MFIDDLGLEFPEFDSSRLPSNGFELNRELSITNGIMRAWDLRPNSTKMLLNYKEDSFSYTETLVAHGDNAVWMYGHRYFDGVTSLQYVDLCTAHNIREVDNRNLFTFSVSFVCDVLPSVGYGKYQSILGGKTGYIALQIVGDNKKLRVGKEGVASIYVSNEIMVVGKRYDIVWINDRFKTIDGVNTTWLYINGKLDGVSTVTQAFDWFMDPLMLGQRRGVSDGGKFFHGWIDYPVMWNRGLTKSEAIAHTLNPTEIYKGK